MFQNPSDTLPVLPSSRHDASHQQQFPSVTLKQYAVAVAAVVVAVLLKLLVAPWLPQENPFLFFFAAVMVSAWYGGGGPGLLATAAAALASDFFFLEPHWSFSNYSHEQMARLVEFASEGCVISFLGGLLYRARQTAEKAAEGERHSREEAQRARAELALAFEKQRRIAETLQRSLLPEIAPNLFPGLDVVALYEAALDEARIGGDFYDAFSLTDGRVVLVVGDVSGKGLAAAERTAEAKYALRSLLHQNPTPHEALTSLNRHLCLPRHSISTSTEDIPSFRFIAVSLAVVDPQSGDVVLALAGAELPLVVQTTINQSAEAVEVTEVGGDTKAFGLPLGIEKSAVYQPIRLHLEIGDTLLLFTDGLTEARRNGVRGTFLDAAGFQEFVRQEYSGRISDTLNSCANSSANSSTAHLGQALLERVQSFAGGTLQDDACLVLARRCSVAFPAGKSAEPLENKTE